MSMPANVQNMQPSLGRGKIGAVTPEHIKAVNDWLAPLVERDCMGHGSALGASDIVGLLELGRANDLPAVPQFRLSNATNLLLIDLGQVVTQIRWGNGPWTENVHSTDMRVRLTRRGRTMLQKCCRDLWDQMMFGKPEGRYGSHTMSIAGPCDACYGSPEMIEDGLVSKECPGRVPEKDVVLLVSRGVKFLADGHGGYITAPHGLAP